MGFWHRCWRWLVPERSGPPIPKRELPPETEEQRRRAYEKFLERLAPSARAPLDECGGCRVALARATEHRAIAECVDCGRRWGPNYDLGRAT
jgi:hypothetical protein